MASSLRRVHVWVVGRVQGVYFRQTAAREGARLGLAGWVKNLADGRVEAVAEGSPESVEAWLLWCRGGPPNAQVEGVDICDEPPEGLQGFSVINS